MPRSKFCSYVVIAGVVLLYVFVFYNQIRRMTSPRHRLAMFPEASTAHDCKSLRLSIEHPLVKTALASFPGSGNTWVRHLLQQATGFYTGSVYHDKTLQSSGFPAEGIEDGSVIVVKTHLQGPAARASFRRAVLLIRNPMDAIRAEFNRRYDGHTGHAPPQLFRSIDWSWTVVQNISRWVSFYLDWLTFDGPVLVMWYENIRSDMHGELMKMAQFLDQNVTQTDLECAINNSAGHFHRKKKSHMPHPLSDSIKLVVTNSMETVKLAFSLRNQLNNKTASQSKADM